MLQNPVPGEPTITFTDWFPTGTVAIGHTNGHGRPDVRLDQVEPASTETWRPVAPAAPAPPALVAEEEPKYRDP